MSNSEELLKKFGKLIENGINSYKDLNSEIINICKSKRDEFLLKMKIVGKEDLDILRKRIEKIVGKKRVESFLDKRKGLGKSRGSKIVDYAWRKPASTKRRVKRINTALDVAPYAATGAGAVGIMSMMSGNNNNNNKNNNNNNRVSGCRGWC